MKNPRAPRSDMLAPAKINLFFQLTGKRDDGYHFVNSLVAFASVGDQLTIREAPITTFEATGNFASHLPEPSEQNWILRVLREVERLSGVNIPLHITLTKNLPVASGIGGGTADGAALLRWIREHRKDHAPDSITKTAGYMGADGMVCLKSAPSFVQGIGEIVTPVSLPTFFVVLMNPNKPLATRDVFARFDGGFAKAEPSPHSFADMDSLVRYLSQRKNQLQPAATEMMPDIHTMIEALEKSEGCLLARMSGSGATCFGLFETLAKAKEAAQLLSQHFPDYWVECGEAGGSYGA
jgi:4-diphosphocytidyl-2-C-methyl-D-erythritol kinase